MTTYGFCLDRWRETVTPFDEPHLADELDVLSLDLLHHHDLHFVEEVEGEVAQSVSVTGQFDVNIKLHKHVYLESDQDVD